MNLYSIKPLKWYRRNRWVYLLEDDAAIPFSIIQWEDDCWKLIVNCKVKFRAETVDECKIFADQMNILAMEKLLIQHII